MIYEVIVDIGATEVDRVFDYRSDDDIELGRRVVVPFGKTKKVEGFVLGKKERSDRETKDIEAVLDDRPAVIPEMLALCDKLTETCAFRRVDALRLFVPPKLRGGRVREKLTDMFALVEGVDAEKAADGLKKTATAQKGILSYLSENGETEGKVLRDLFSGQALTALEKSGLVARRTVQIGRTPYKSIKPIIKEVELTAEQKDAVNIIETTDKRRILIHGVTGSGKTEIYLQLIAREIAKGKTAIFLVPEISLTPQMLSQLRARFKGEAAILHSGLSAGEKFDEWWRLRSGEAKIAIGARSAIFAPLENLGLIVIDEEHDSSYVSEQSPRYSTVDVAKMRAEYNGCKLILGSATPSVESFVEANEGRYNLITLTERINKKPMPEITIADMRKEVKRGNASPFSLALREELKETLENGNQAIIFLNRRGYSQKVICRDCGYVAKCENCDVTLTYHSEDDCLKCHYCGARYKMLSACPECGGTHVRYSGTGTQRVVAELNELFPKARILRMDNDTVSGKDGHYKILSKFAKKEADVLVGTQMIAKGHDFPSVTLVGILDADMSLQFSDYRSGERTFQLITQVSGRSGRADMKGKVVLQTYCPENYILRYAVNYDYLGFFNNEIEIRKATSFPPYSLICRVMVTGEDEKKTVAALKDVYFAVENLRGENPDEFIFLNKMHSPVKRIQGKHRYQVLMRLKTKKLLERIYEIAVSSSTADVLVYVEENPANLS